jgi:SAM domain (Sterile alpha motif)
MMDVGAWLRGLGLERYEAAFRENEIDETVLPALTAEDLKDLGVVAYQNCVAEIVTAFRQATRRPSRACPGATPSGLDEMRTLRKLQSESPHLGVVGRQMGGQGLGVNWHCVMSWFAASLPRRPA